MLVLNPPIAKFGPNVWNDVVAILVDRLTDRTVVERGDIGPHITLVDSPEQRVLIHITREIVRDDLNTPKPSQLGELLFYTAPAASDSLRRRVRVNAVITAVTHDVGKLRGAVQSITLVAVSPDGIADPLIVEDASDGTL
jgi:hypothetical protein